MADVVEDRSLDGFLDALGYRFDDVTLLELALTHRSYCAENTGYESNERLEFLGDAVLGLAITDAIFRNEPAQPEGELAKARAEVVSTTTLADLARDIGIGPLLRLGRGEDMSAGRDKDSILADAMEAVIGAVYLDSDWPTVLTLVERLLGRAAAEAQVTPGVRDYKTRLQEIAADLGYAAPVYRVSSSGPDHGRVFRAEVNVGPVLGAGTGSSKKQAQQEAAAQALSDLEPRIAAGDGGEGAR